MPRPCMPTSNVTHAEGYRHYTSTLAIYRVSPANSVPVQDNADIPLMIDSLAWLQPNAILVNSRVSDDEATGVLAVVTWSGGSMAEGQCPAGLTLCQQDVSPQVQQAAL